MAKNAPNELKLGPDIYIYELYQIPEDFWKIFKIDQFSAEKWSFFSQKSADFQNFSKSFKKLIKPIEIHIWSKNQLI